MPTTLTDRFRALIAGLLYFLPALALTASAAWITHPLVLLILLLAQPLYMAAACHAIGFDLESSYLRTALRRGVAYFVLLIGYTAVVAALLAYPLLWLLRDGSLSATLALSTALVVALLSLWRLWPAFGLVFVWDDAYPDDGSCSWISTAIARSWTFARHLTRSHDIFFSHGLLVALCLLALVVGALSLAGLCGVLPSEFRIVALAAYALVLAPLAHLIIANRCVRSLLAELRRTRRGQVHAHAHAPLPPAEAEAEAASAAVVPADLPDDLDQDALDRIVLRAARAGQVDVALAALERGAAPAAAPAPGERDQRSVLMFAATLPDVRLLRQLIARGADINAHRAGLTPLLAATRDSYQGRPDAVLTLLTNGADPGAADGEGNTPLHYAALSGDPAVAALLLDAAAPLDPPNHEGLTPLGVACAAGNWSLARFLLKRGARPEVEHAQPALHGAAAVAEDDPEGVELLLKFKAPVDTRGALGRTALMSAALNGNAAISAALLRAGAEVDLADSHGVTALMEAARAGAVGVIDALATRKPDANRCDAVGRSALIIACQSRQSGEAAVRALRALGADAALTGSDGKTALDHALAAGRWPLVALLDPSRPLPATVADANGANALPVDAGSPAHLLDALRFGHWHIVEQFNTTVRAWPEAERAELYLQLATASPPASRYWLLNHGLAADAAGTNGQSLFAALLAQAPATLPALGELVGAGAQVAGAGLLAELLLASQGAAPPQQALVEALALALIERGADIFGAAQDGADALNEATSLGSATLVAALAARGADPNARDTHGRTPLHRALALPAVSALAVCRELLRFGADPNALTATGETPLGLALARPERELGAWLRFSCWPFPGRPWRADDLPAAATVGDIEAVDKLLSFRFPVDAPDAQGASALLRACGGGHAALVEHLLAAGAAPALTASAGATCLSAAVSAQRLPSVMALLHHGVEVDQRLPGGGTALMIAAALGLPELAEPLLAHGACINAVDEHGNTPLHAAAQYAFQCHDASAARRLLALLLERGAVLEGRNDAGQSALLLLLGAGVEPGPAIEQKHLLAVLPLLIEHAADLSAQDLRGVGVLHACALHGLLLPARLLLGARADRSLRDCMGRTARDLAERLGYADLAAELEEERAIPGAAHTLRKAAAPDPVP